MYYFGFYLNFNLIFRKVLQKLIKYNLSLLTDMNGNTMTENNIKKTYLPQFLENGLIDEA